MHNYNATARHSRHSMTRYGAWSRIREEQLRIAPPLDVCRELARTAPIERKVNDFLRGKPFIAYFLANIHMVFNRTKTISNLWDNQ